MLNRSLSPAVALVAALAVALALVLTGPEGSRLAGGTPPHDRGRGHDAPGAATVTGRSAPVTTKPTPLAPASAPPPAWPATTLRWPNGAAGGQVPPAIDVPTVTPPAAATLPGQRVTEPGAVTAPPGEPSPPPGPSTPRADTVTPAPPPEPLVIADAHVDTVSSSSAKVTFRTNLPARTVASYGTDDAAVWTPAETADTREHQAVLNGLSFSTTYHVWLHARDEYDQTQTAAVTLTTEPMDATTTAATSGDRIQVNGEPFFPLAVWAQCSDGYAGNMADGINLFIGDGCGEDRQLAARLAGRAFSIVDAKDADASGRGVIGWHLPDEWDASLDGNVTRDQLRASLPDEQPGKISFLTLTNHFYSHAAPLPQGKGMYPTLYSLPDVVGFDLYPLQVWCRPAFGDVFEAQHELSDVTDGKPTFQWIEVARMEHPCRENPVNDPTPATVRAETWLAVAGGADGIGYFPNHWSDDIGAEIARTNRQIRALAPALLSPHVPATSDAPAVKVSARTLNGALYVIAVNTGYEAVQAKISVDGIAGRSATRLGGGVVGSDDTGVTDTFGPLEAKVYMIPPRGW